MIQHNKKTILDHDTGQSTVSVSMNPRNPNSNIFIVGRTVETHIGENAQAIFDNNADQLLDEFNRIGDEAYGTYLNLLFEPIHQRFKEAGLRAAPGLPGNFGMSREWGNADETDQQRWMWSTIKRIDTSGGKAKAGEAIGTIVVIVFHDHSQFRLPRLPQIIALAETGKAAVVNALSQRSDEFKNALEFKLWYAEYLKHLV